MAFCRAQFEGSHCDDFVCRGTQSRLSNKLQRERKLPLKVTIATTREILKYTAWNLTIVLRIMRNASAQI